VGKSKEDKIKQKSHTHKIQKKTVYIIIIIIKIIIIIILGE
jgi:hypothetical protein